jgi:DNA-binding transcriptional MerR regulator
VGEVARLSGVTVRTLHHYDEIGLLVPSGRTAAGHRGYSDEDLDRLRRILFYRELGFGLDGIATILAEGDATEHLRRQHRLLTERIEQLHGMVAAVERDLEANTMGIKLTQEEKFELFGDFDPVDAATEAERRWGGTAVHERSHQQSQSRIKQYTKADWEKILGEQADLFRGLAEAVAEGAAPDSERAMDLVEEHRLHITRWYYDCSHEMQRKLGEMYVSSEEFTAVYEEQVGPGGAEFVKKAIDANAERAGK